MAVRDGPSLWHLIASKMYKFRSGKCVVNVTSGNAVNPYSTSVVVAAKRNESGSGLWLSLSIVAMCTYMHGKAENDL